MNSALHSAGRPSDVPFAVRPKRSASNQFDNSAPRTFVEPVANYPRDYGDDSTFLPTTISEHLLERTYLEDVVRPLVRALVKARMTYGPLSHPGNEQAQIYADLDRLRGELEKSASRTRHAEQERDDLARRLDLAGMPEPPYREHEFRDRPDSYLDHPSSDSYFHQTRKSTAGPSRPQGSKRSHYGDSDMGRIGSEHRGEGNLSVTVSHAEGPSADISVTADPNASDPGSHSKSPSKNPVELSMPYVGYSNVMPSLDRNAEQELGGRHGARSGPSGSAINEPDPHHGYVNGRDRWYSGGLHTSAIHRSNMARFSDHVGYSSSGASSYLPTSTSSERSPLPGLHTHSTTPSSGNNGSTPYAAMHTYKGDIDADAERARKIARTRPSEAATLLPPSTLRPAHSPSTANTNHAITPVNESSNNPQRKLAATKNRTCSSCSAPHDAKFRRGPNGPGTLCDRCGSRFKKFKEQELTARKAKRETSELDPAGHYFAKTSARTRLSSSSSSSQSPMDAVVASNTARDTTWESEALLASTEPSSSSSNVGDDQTLRRDAGASGDLPTDKDIGERRNYTRRESEQNNGVQAQPSSQYPVERSRSESHDELMER